MNDRDYNTLAPKAMERLTGIYVNDYDELPTSTDLPNCIAGWYHLDPDEADDFIKVLKIKYPDDMKDLGYIESSSTRTLDLIEDPITLVNNVFGEIESRMPFLHYIGMSVEGGRWIILDPKDDSLQREMCEEAVEMGLLDEADGKFTIAGAALDKIEEYYRSKR